MEQQKSLSEGSLSLLPDNNSRDNRFKIAIFGDVGTGKTCIFSQYSEKKFNSKYEPTIGVEFASKDIVLEDEMVRLQIWDLSGQPAYLSIRSPYLKGSKGVLLCYDVTNRTSLENLATLIKAIKDLAKWAPEIVLIGNKCDLEKFRVVSKEEGQEFAKKNDFLFLETSALDSTNVELAFHFLAMKVYNKERKLSKKEAN